MKSNKVKIFWLGILAGIIWIALYAVEGYLTGTLRTMPSVNLITLLGSYWYLWISLGSLIMGILLVWAYTLTHCSCGEECCSKGVARGLLFGLGAWLAGILPVLGYAFATVPLPGSIFAIWLVMSLVNLLILGATVGQIYK